jgi:hypothetical protein
MRYVRYAGTVRDGSAVNTAVSHAGGHVFVPFLETEYSGRYLVLSVLPPSVTGFPPRRPGFDPRSDYMGFVVDKVFT